MFVAALFTDSRALDVHHGAWGKHRTPDHGGHADTHCTQLGRAPRQSVLHDSIPVQVEKRPDCSAATGSRSGCPGLRSGTRYWKGALGTSLVLGMFCVLTSGGYMLHACVKTHQTVHLKWVHFVVSKSCIIETG